MASKDFLTLKEAISKALKCVTTVVLTVTIEEHLRRIDTELEKELDKVTSLSSGLSPDVVKLSMKQKTLELSNFILTHQLSVDKEVQKNTWCIQF